MNKKPVNYEESYSPEDDGDYLVPTDQMAAEVGIDLHDYYRDVGAEE